MSSDADISYFQTPNDTKYIWIPYSHSIRSFDTFSVGNESLTTELNIHNSVHLKLIKIKFSSFMGRPALVQSTSVGA